MLARSSLVVWCRRYGDSTQDPNAWLNSIAPSNVDRMLTTLVRACARTCVHACVPAFLRACVRVYVYADNL